MAWIKHEDLGGYLNSTYPEMKFHEEKCEYKKEIYSISFISGISKKVFCEFEVDTLSEKDWESLKDIWTNRTLVHLSFTNNKDGICGSGHAVDNRAEMISGIDKMVKRVKDALGMKESQMQQLTIEDVLADMERGDDPDGSSKKDGKKSVYSLH